MPPFPERPIAQEMKIIIMDMKIHKMYRGLINFIIPAATNLPMAKRPWAMARRLEPVALLVPGRTNST